MLPVILIKSFHMLLLTLSLSLSRSLSLTLYLSRHIIEDFSNTTMIASFHSPLVLNLHRVSLPVDGMQLVQVQKSCLHVKYLENSDLRNFKSRSGKTNEIYKK